MKLTLKQKDALIEFNKLRKRIGEPKYTPEEYYNYIYGKTKLIKTKSRYKGIDVPVWANTHKDVPSVTTNHIPTKPRDDFKKEVSKNYTISIPFNKGSYSVIPKSEIHCIGKK
nr:MAG: hypothetical protein [Caudoviricetes sp.]